jgi:hypothetical protein
MKHLFQLFAIYFLVKVYWVDSYLRSNTLEEDSVAREELHVRDDDSFDLKIDDDLANTIDDHIIDENQHTHHNFHHAHFHHHVDDNQPYYDDFDNNQLDSTSYLDSHLDDYRANENQHAHLNNHHAHSHHYSEDDDGFKDNNYNYNDFIYNQPYYDDSDNSQQDILDSRLDDDDWNEYDRHWSINYDALIDDDVNAVDS